MSKAKLAAETARIGAHFARERISSHRPTSLDEVPGSIDALTCEWLTAALCADHPGAEVRRFFTGEAHHGTGSRCPLVVEYNRAGREAGLPERIFTKSTWTLMSRLFTGLAGLADAETNFYAQLRPQMEVETPAIYSAHWDPVSRRAMLLLEDVLATKDVTFCDPRETYVDRPMAESLVDTLAAVHGAFWASPELEGKPWLRTAMEFQNTIDEQIDFEKRTMVGVERSEAILPRELLDRRKEIYPATLRSIELHERSPQALIHQDVHIRNWYVTPDRTMGVHDWQCVARGHWALDYSYAVTSALTVEDRRAWERDLLARYLEQLAAAGGDAPSFDDAWLAYRQQVFHGLIFWLYTIGAGRMQPDMQPKDVCDVFNARMGQAVVDLESLDSV